MIFHGLVKAPAVGVWESQLQVSTHTGSRNEETVMCTLNIYGQYDTFK